MPSAEPGPLPAGRSQVRALLLGGILPVVAFTVIEEVYGTVWGLVAGMVFGVGEIAYEWRTQKKVDPFTWGGNGMLLVLGGVSLFTQNGLWFKLQPGILEAVMGGALVVSVVLGKPFMVAMARKQGVWDRIQPAMQPVMYGAFRGMTLRIGLFFWAHAALATWAALYWSTRVWAVLKGVGFTLSFIVYLVAETGVLRYRIRKSQSLKNL